MQKFRFAKPNRQNKILMNVKREFQEVENAKIRHFSHILDHRTEFWKYASFEGAEIARTSFVYGVFSIKKALLKSAKIENSRTGKSDFLVQNVKNQFFHELPWRGIWVIQTLTFGVYFSNLGNNLHHLQSSIVPHTSHVVFGSPR